MKALIIGLGSIGLRHRRILKKIKKISQIKFFSKHKYNDKNNLKSRKEIPFGRLIIQPSSKFCVNCAK